MANTNPTPISCFEALYLCVLLIVSPKRFTEMEIQDTAKSDSFVDQPEIKSRAELIRNAFGNSFGLVLASATFGYLIGYAMQSFGRCATSDTVFASQLIGTCLLLWGTLFVRGWEIQSNSGVTLSERVNQWLYRSLYCLGTAIIVYSLAFSTCKA